MEQAKLGRYLIDSELGRGAMGVVYKATDPVLGRTVAVKTVNMALEQDGADKFEARFYQEARAAGGLNHPNIVTVYDVGKSGEVAYMAMEFLEGVELRTMLGDGHPLPLLRAVSIAAQVAEGLAFAHDHGVVHRDIKPANIMVSAAAPVKITDFGIILYEMLTGAAPFNGDNVTALMYQIVNFAPPAPGAISGSVPQLLDYIVAKMLAKPLEERYQSAHEVARDLRECERQLAGTHAAAAAARVDATTVPGLASGPDPQLVDTKAQKVLLAQTLNRTRQEDLQLDEATVPPARGLAHSFDSLAATQRLAALTGASTVPEPEAGAATAPQTATQAIDSLHHRQPRPGWRRRDWLLLGGAGVLGLLFARALARRRPD